MKSARYVLFLLLASLILPTVSQEMNSNKGRILLAGLVLSPAGNPETGALEGVLVEIVGSEWKTKTDKRGLFVFTKAPHGPVTLRLSKSGFQSVMRSTTIDSRSLMPVNLSVEMLANGMRTQGEALTGRGVLYVAYSSNQERNVPPGRFKWNDLDRRGEWLYSDPLENVTNTQYSPSVDPSKRLFNPITLAPNHIMLYPPTAPQRSSFHQLTDPPNYLAFGPGGDQLFVAGRRPEIRVYDENSGHEQLALIPLPHGGFVTDLSLAKNEEHLLATVASTTPGILAVNTSNLRSDAYLPLDGLSNGVPTCVESGQPGTLLVSVARQGQAGQLLIVDAMTGATLHNIEVGSSPTSVSTTPDKRLAYVANSNSGSVTVVNLETRQRLGSLAVGVAPQQTAVTPDGKTLLVTNQGSDTLSVINTEQQRVIGFVRVGKAPAGLAISADGTTCYVSNRTSQNISKVNLKTLKQVHQTDPMPHSRPLGIVLRE